MPKQLLRDFFKDASVGEQGDGRISGYTISFDVGTPPQRISAALDITSDIVWLRCSNGTATSSQQQGTLFDPLLSSSTAEEPCETTRCRNFAPQIICGVGNPLCSYTYMSSSNGNTSGYLTQEEFMLDSDPVKVVFGCSLRSEGDYATVSGVIGLGRGAFSLVSQLGVERFSYYLAPDDSSESFIHFGDSDGDNSFTPKTPLLASSDKYRNFYYVGLTGVQVDGKDLPIPTGTFDLDTDGSGGVMLSITMPVTFLDERAYGLLREALASKIGLPIADGSALGLDLCYKNESLATAKIPAMALVFDGGAVMELETWNYFYMDAVTGLECLTILPSKAGGGSVLGNLIQAGTHIIYDVSGSELLFHSLEKAAPPAPLDSSIGAPPILSLVLVNFVWILVYTL